MRREYNNDSVVHGFENNIECYSGNLKSKIITTQIKGKFVDVLALYSYSTIIAFKYDDKTIVNNANYSNTTSRHLSLVRRYCSDIQYINDCFFNMYLSLKIKSFEDVISFYSEAEDLYKSYRNSRKYKEYCLKELNSYIADLVYTVDNFCVVDKRSKAYKKYFALVSDPMNFLADKEIADKEEKLKKEKQKIAKEKKAKRSALKALSDYRKNRKKVYYSEAKLASLRSLNAYHLQDDTLYTFLNLDGLRHVNATKNRSKLLSRYENFRSKLDHTKLNKHLRTYIIKKYESLKKWDESRKQKVDVSKLYRLFIDGKIKTIPRGYKSLGDTFTETKRGGNLISNQNVVITKKDATLFYIALKRGSLKVGETVLHYKIRSIEKDYISIGCHIFFYETIEYVYNRLIKNREV